MRHISPEKALCANVFCFTTTRTGGFSTGAYSSFNLAQHVGDEPEDVEKNRRTLSQYLQAASATHFGSFKKQAGDLSVNETLYKPLPFLTQVHSSNVLSADEDDISSIPCDGVYSSQAEQALVILTADCLPIILVSTQSNEIAAVHAGWKGLVNGVIENALTRFSAPRESISVWIGPGICQKHFEVGEELLEKFSNYNAQIVSGKRQKYHIDLAGIAESILQKQGVIKIQRSNACTYCRDDLFSFRRSTHQGLSDCGRMATVVMRY